MLPEKIEQLLNSKDHEDNAVGWELVSNQKISYNDIQDYLERTRVPVRFRYKYYWDSDFNKFIRTAEDDY